MYLEKHYNRESIINTLRIELNYSLFCNKKFIKGLLMEGLDGNWVIKKLFNSLRYHDTAKQLIHYQNIYDFTRMNNTKKIIREKMESNEEISKIHDFIYSKIKELLKEL